MVCIYCGAKTEIFNSRHSKRNNGTWRRRRCIKCDALISTVEEPVYSKQWVVKNNKGHLTPFYRDKLYTSIVNSLGHRMGCINEASGITTTVIDELRNISKTGLLTREAIINTTSSCLSKFDKAGGVQYMAYHKI